MAAGAAAQKSAGVRTPTDQECCLWVCYLCQASGCLLLDPDVAGRFVAAVTLIDEITRLHLEASPVCVGVLGDVSILRPAGWFQELGRALVVRSVPR